ncbi:aldo/keto reductase [Verrucomicrobiota bacterium]
MLYKEYGKTGKKVSVISAGGMRHADPENLENSTETLLRAYENGINYFDTAPTYCDDLSEKILGHATKQMKPGSFYLSTKSMKENGGELREQLETSLERLGVDRIDFFHIWCLLSPETWERRKKGGAIEAALKAKEEGLIEHLAFSTHMTHAYANDVIDEGIFDGVLLGYCPINFPLRQQVVDHAHAKGLGVITMNPLGGGIIPQNAARFDFIRGERDPDVVSAALRFNISQPGITSALVGFRNASDVDSACAALTHFEPYDDEHINRLKNHIEHEFAGLCTGCGYCMPCPAGIDIPRMMDAYNQKILQGTEDAIANRLKWHWGMRPAEASACIECGQCEKACTQHLPIIERLEQIAKLPECKE